MLGDYRKKKRKKRIKKLIIIVSIVLFLQLLISVLSFWVFIPLNALQKEVGTQEMYDNLEEQKEFLEKPEAIIVYGVFGVMMKANIESKQEKMLAEGIKEEVHIKTVWESISEYIQENW